jgi:hypothetical protein
MWHTFKTSQNDDIQRIWSGGWFKGRHILLHKYVNRIMITFLWRQIQLIIPSRRFRSFECRHFDLFWKYVTWSTYDTRYSASFPAATSLSSDPSPFWLVLKVCHMITFSITWYSLFYTSDIIENQIGDKHLIILINQLFFSSWFPTLIELQVTCRWFSQGTPVSSTNKTDRHDKQTNKQTNALLPIKTSTMSSIINKNHSIQ